jgi:hypothetical protein
METKIIEAKAIEASERIRLAGAHIDLATEQSRTGASCTDALAVSARELGEAKTALDALLAELDPGPPPAMRACQACGRSIRANATLCGYCWTKQ